MGCMREDAWVKRSGRSKAGLEALLPGRAAFSAGHGVHPDCASLECTKSVAPDCASPHAVADSVSAHGRIHLPMPFFDPCQRWPRYWHWAGDAPAPATARTNHGGLPTGTTARNPSHQLMEPAAPVRTTPMALEGAGFHPGPMVRIRWRARFHPGLGTRWNASLQSQAPWKASLHVRTAPLRSRSVWTSPALLALSDHRTAAGDLLPQACLPQTTGFSGAPIHTPLEAPVPSRPGTDVPEEAASA